MRVYFEKIVEELCLLSFVDLDDVQSFCFETKSKYSVAKAC